MDKSGAVLFSLPRMKSQSTRRKTSCLGLEKVNAIPRKRGIVFIFQKLISSCHLDIAGFISVVKMELVC